MIYQRNGQHEFPIEIVVIDDGVDETQEVLIVILPQEPSSHGIYVSVGELQQRNMIFNLNDPLPVELTRLLIDGEARPSERRLRQSEVGLAVEVTLTLTARDQQGDAFALTGVMSEIADASGDSVAQVAMVTVAADGLSAVALLRITPHEDEDARVVYRAFIGETEVTATIFVDAIERAPAGLELIPGAGVSAQSMPGEIVSATLFFRVVDNYGAAADHLVEEPLLLSAETDDNLPLRLSATTLPPGSDQGFSVYLTPLMDTTLTVTARLGALERVWRLPVDAAPPPVATRLLLNGGTMAMLFLDQAVESGLRRPVSARLRLQGFDQYGEAVAASVEITATATAGAALSSLPTSLPVEGLTLDLQITPLEDADTVVVLRVSAAAAVATAVIVVDAVERRLARLELAAAMDVVVQSAADQRLDVDFDLRLVDNYGDSDRLPPMEVRLEAEAEGSARVEAPPASLLLSTPTVVTVRVAPQGRDTELTLEARLGRLSALETVSIDAVETAILTLDGDSSVKVDEEDLVSFVVSLGVEDAAGMMTALDGGEVRLSATADVDLEIVDAAVIDSTTATALAVALSSTRVSSMQSSVDVMVTARWRGVIATELRLRARRTGFGDAELRVRILPGHAVFDLDGSGAVETEELVVMLRYLLLDTEARLTPPTADLMRNLPAFIDEATLAERLAVFGDPDYHGLLDLDGDGEENGYDGRLLVRYFMFGSSFTAYDRRAAEQMRLLLGL